MFVPLASFCPSEISLNLTSSKELFQTAKLKESFSITSLHSNPLPGTYRYPIFLLVCLLPSFLVQLCIGSSPQSRLRDRNKEDQNMAAIIVLLLVDCYYMFFSSHFMIAHEN